MTSEPMTPNPSDDTIWILTTTELTAETTETIDIGGRRDGRDTGGSWGTSIREKATQAFRQRVPISASLLQQEMNGLLKVLGKLFEEAQQHTKGLELEEVELSVEINSEGQISLVGNQASVGSNGAITLKFKRASNPPTPNSGNE